MMNHMHSWRFILLITLLVVISGTFLASAAGVGSDYKYFTVKVGEDEVVIVKPLLRANKIGNIYLLKGKPGEIPFMNSVAMEYLKIVRDLGLGKPRDYIIGERLESSDAVSRLWDVGLKVYGVVYYDKGVSLLVYNDSIIPNDTVELRKILGIKDYKGLIVVRYSLLTSNYPKHMIEDRIIEYTPRLEKLGMYQVSYIYDLPALYFDEEYIVQNNVSVNEIIDTVRELITGKYPLIITISPADSDEGLENNVYHVHSNNGITINKSHSNSSETMSINKQYPNTSITPTAENPKNKTINSEKEPRNNPSNNLYLSITITGIVGALIIFFTRLKH